MKEILQKVPERMEDLKFSFYLLFSDCIYLIYEKGEEQYIFSYEEGNIISLSEKENFIVKQFLRVNSFFKWKEQGKIRAYPIIKPIYTKNLGFAGYYALDTQNEEVTFFAYHEKGNSKEFFVKTEQKCMREVIETFPHIKVEENTSWL